MPTPNNSREDEKSSVVLERCIALQRQAGRQAGRKRYNNTQMQSGDSLSFVLNKFDFKCLRHLQMIDTGPC